jgi:ammonia channel protein AmtB
VFESAHGVMLLWFGFYGFNALGSLTDLDEGYKQAFLATGMLGRIILNTTLCPSAAMITVTFLTRCAIKSLTHAVSNHLLMHLPTKLK